MSGLESAEDNSSIPLIDDEGVMDAIRDINERADSVTITLSDGTIITGDEMIDRGYICNANQNAGQAVMIEPTISGDVEWYEVPGNQLYD